mmetsp:Transcript_67220/g.194388  ORF Transcript_67220/g.194388 Transcript_67220/m.194388 type:complete len:265 (+) Transcript_67220:132-926(+)
MGKGIWLKKPCRCQHMLALGAQFSAKTPPRMKRGAASPIVGKNKSATQQTTSARTAHWYAVEAHGRSVALHGKIPASSSTPGLMRGSMKRSIRGVKLGGRCASSGSRSIAGREFCVACCASSSQRALSTSAPDMKRAWSLRDGGAPLLVLMLLCPKVSSSPSSSAAVAGNREPQAKTFRNLAGRLGDESKMSGTGMAPRLLLLCRSSGSGRILLLLLFTRNFFRPFASWSSGLRTPSPHRSKIMSARSASNMCTVGGVLCACEE